MYFLHEMSQGPPHRKDKVSIRWTYDYWWRAGGIKDDIFNLGGVAGGVTVGVGGRGVLSTESSIADLLCAEGGLLLGGRVGLR